MKTLSRIFMLAPSDFANGECGVCGAAAMLKYRDASTGLRAGLCCLADLIQAESLIATSFAVGLRHPTLAESQSR